MLFSGREFISFLIYHDGVWNEINLYATVVSCLSRFTLVQLSCVREARSAFNIVDRVIYNGTVCHKVYGRVQITTRDLFFFSPLFVRSRFRSGLVNLTYQAQINYEVTGRLVPRGWKVALAKFRFAFATRKEEEKERGGRDGGGGQREGWGSRISSVRVIEIWGTRFSHGRRDLAFQGCSVFANTRVFLSMRFSRCNLIHLQAYPSTSIEVRVTRLKFCASTNLSTGAKIEHSEKNLFRYIIQCVQFSKLHSTWKLKYDCLRLTSSINWIN